MSKTERKEKGITLSEDVKILKPVVNCKEVPDYFRCSFRDETWFVFYCPQPNRERILLKQLDRCKKRLGLMMDITDEDCRRAQMMLVWLTRELDERRQLALHTYETMMKATEEAGHKKNRIEKILRLFRQVELAPSSP